MTSSDSDLEAALKMEYFDVVGGNEWVVIPRVLKEKLIERLDRDRKMKAELADEFKRAEWFRLAVDIRNGMLTPKGYVRKGQVHTVKALDKLIDGLDDNYARIYTLLAAGSSLAGYLVPREEAADSKTEASAEPAPKERAKE